MSSTPVPVQISFLRAGLNSTIIGVLLFGIYTAVYASTVYAYMTRDGAQRPLVVATITAIYAVTIVEVGTQWWFIVWQFVDNGASRDSIWNSQNSPPSWFFSLNGLCVFLVYIFGDGLLIWRCFHVWNRSPFVVALPLFLWVAEISLALATTTLAGLLLSDINPSPQGGLTDNRLQIATYVISLSTTLLASSLIAYRIHSVSKQNGNSVRRFKHIINIVIESSVFSSLSLLVLVIDTILVDDSPFSTNLTGTLNAFSAYGGAISSLVAGVAPTIMVARIALLAPSATYPTTISHVSGLQFRGDSILQNGTQDWAGSVIAVGHEGSSEVRKETKEVV